MREPPTSRRESTIGIGIVNAAVSRAMSPGYQECISHVKGPGLSGVLLNAGSG